jgi:hypothetical protein
VEQTDICDLSPEKRRELIQRYAQFVDQLQSVGRAMTDSFAGQLSFDFYACELEPHPYIGERPELMCIFRNIT